MRLIQFDNILTLHSYSKQTNHFKIYIQIQINKKYILKL